MKNKIIFSFVIFIVLLLSIVFANSYVKAISKQEKLEIKKEILEQEVKNDKITKEQANSIYRNIEEKIVNCDNNCRYNKNCEIYQQNSNCIRQNNQCLQKSYNCTRSCTNRMNNR